ncbi:MAG: jacalin-like lectin [Planctomycetota bacterium]
MNAANTFLFAVVFGLGAFSTVANAQLFDQKQGPYGSTLGSAFDEIAAGGLHIDQIDVIHNFAVHGLRFHYSDPQRTTRSQSPWLGSNLGVPTAFQIAAGDYLAEIDMWYEGPLVRALTLRTQAGQSASYGSATPTSAMVTLALADHEIVGFHGVASPALSSLGVHLRPAWEVTMAPVQTLVTGVRVRHVASPRAHISEVHLAEKWFQFGGPSFTGIRYVVRDEFGATIATTPWHGDSTTVPVKLIIPNDDYLEQVVIYSTGTWIFGIRLNTRKGRSQSVGSGASRSANTFTASPHHELVGHFGEEDPGSPQWGTAPGFVSLGFVERPLAARTWQFGTGCPDSTGVAPTLQVDTPRIGGALGLHVIGPSGTAGVALMDLQPASLALGSCTLLVGPVLRIPVQLDATGRSSYALPIDNWSWVGGTLYAQAFLLDGLSGNPGSLTEAYGLTIGGI